jgi:DNA recombination protein RmuC
MIIDLMLTAIPAAACGFAIAWLFQSSRMTVANLANTSRIESSQDQIRSLQKDLEAERSTHAELLDAHVTESRLRAAADAVASRVPDLKLEVDVLQQQVKDLLVRAAELETELEASRSTLKEQQGRLEQAQVTLKDSFMALSAEALQNNNQSFIELAKASFATIQVEAKNDLDARQVAVDQLVQPIRDSLSKVDSKLNEIEHQRVASYSALQEQLRGLVETHLPTLATNTGNLVKALRQPTVRGRYGEVQLKRVVEMAGMLEHCDFVQQDSLTTEMGRLRPDLIVKLPGGRHIVVDAKTPVAAYLEAIEAADEATQKMFTCQHAQQFRKHITTLGRKAYWDQFTPTPEFVVMFVPGEVFFSAALQEDPTLLESGVEEKVIPATPTTLIALLRAVAYGWRQEKLAQNAEEVAKLGKEIYERISTLGRHWMEVGDRLGRAVEAYNNSTATLETRVLVSGRRFRELRVSAQGHEIPILKHIDVQPRAVQAPELIPAAHPGSLQIVKDASAR